MIDELHELRKTNPHRPEDLADAVALSRDDLIVALRSDAGRFRLVPTDLGRRWRNRAPSTPARLGWAFALTAIVLALVSISWFGTLDRERDVDVSDTPSTVPTELPAPPTTSSSVASTITSASPSSTAASEPAAESSPPPTLATPTMTDTSTTTASAPTTAGAATTVPSTVSSRPPIQGPFVPGVDLLAVHLDFAHRDDGHAALASREVTEWFALDPLVVAGTASPATNPFAHTYDAIMIAAWGSMWVDAATDRPATVDVVAARWLDVLDAGGHVWVAEGGVSDFSAEVIRVIRGARPGLDTSTRIHIVQHARRNENETRPDDLDEIIANADYIRIDDGNSANDTADLNQSSSAFETAALEGPRRSAWSAGFDYHPAADLDFSDTVAVLHILGIGTDRVADTDDFSSLFMAPD